MTSIQLADMTKPLQERYVKRPHGEGFVASTLTIGVIQSTQYPSHSILSMEFFLNQVRYITSGMKFLLKITLF
jgi:hypothetical protein